MLSIKPCNDRALWTAFLDEQAPPTFLQSWEWKETNEASNHDVIHLGLFENNRLVGTALTIFIKARRGSFLLIPHGPILAPHVPKTQAWNLLTDEWKRQAQTHKAIFIRVCSPLPATPSNTLLLQERGFRHAPIHQHPELAWILDIRPSEEELLKNMRKTTRQSIRKAEEAGVTVKFITDSSGLHDFWKVYQTTVARQHFTAFSRRYLETECEAFFKQGRLIIAIASLQNQIISAAIITLAHGSAFYHHGASDPSPFPKVPAAHLLQWRLIQELKRRGCQFYNFWGVVPESATEHPWHGLSLFKRGFGGFEEAYLHAQDLPLSPRYWLTWIIETIRRKRRNL